MIQAQIFSALAASSDVQELVAGRVYPVRLPKDAVLPAVVYQVSGIEPIRSMSGDSGIDSASVQIAGWAKDYSTAHELGFAVRKALVESGLRIFTDSQSDEEDLETRSYAVVLSFRIWSDLNIGATPASAKNPVYEFDTYAFDGDGVTLSFAIPKFRSGSLILFKNGRLLKKGDGNEYTENETHDGVVFTTAPAGGDYKDEMLAYYAKY